MKNYRSKSQKGEVKCWQCVYCYRNVFALDQKRYRCKYRNGAAVAKNGTCDDAERK